GCDQVRRDSPAATLAGRWWQLPHAGARPGLLGFVWAVVRLVLLLDRQVGPQRTNRCAIGELLSGGRLCLAGYGERRSSNVPGNAETPVRRRHRSGLRGAPGRANFGVGVGHRRQCSRGCATDLATTLGP